MNAQDQRPLVRYQEFDGQNGLAIEGQALVAYLSGHEVARVALDEPYELSRILRSYAALRLLPGLRFSYSEPRRLEVKVTLDFSLPQQVFGAIEIEGRRELWRAERTRSADFLLGSQLPEQARPWAGAEEPGSGWQFYLPHSLMAGSDPALTRRVAIALEIFLYSIEQDRPIEIPYRRMIDSVFSAERPLWSVNLPRVVTLDERRAQDVF